MRQGYGQGRAGFDRRKTVVVVVVLGRRLADVWLLDDGRMKYERRRRGQRCHDDDRVWVRLRVCGREI